LMSSEIHFRGQQFSSDSSRVFSGKKRRFERGSLDNAKI
jgi:hypothetical protein